MTTKELIESLNVAQVAILTELGVNLENCALVRCADAHNYMCATDDAWWCDDTSLMIFWDHPNRVDEFFYHVGATGVCKPKLKASFESLQVYEDVDPDRISHLFLQLI